MSVVKLGLLTSDPLGYAPLPPAPALLTRTSVHAATGDEDVRWFSYDTRVHVPLTQVSCYLTHTTPETHRLIRENLQETPIYGGWVDSKVRAKGAGG